MQQWKYRGKMRFSLHCSLRLSRFYREMNNTHTHTHKCDCMFLGSASVSRLWAPGQTEERRTWNLIFTLSSPPPPPLRKQQQQQQHFKSNSISNLRKDKRFKWFRRIATVKITKIADSKPKISFNTQQFKFRNKIVLLLAQPPLSWC